MIHQARTEHRMRTAQKLFFFQAEDGIRDDLVLEFRRVLFRSVFCSYSQKTVALPLARPLPRRSRSEERRVGKECRSRWSGEHMKKKGRGGEALRLALL